MGPARTSLDDGGGGGVALTAAVVAEVVGGRLEGNGDTRVSGIAPIDRATADHVSFVASDRYAGALATTRAGAVLLPSALASAATRVPARIIVEKPHEAMLALIPRLYRALPRVPGVHPTAVIGRGVTLGTEVSIGPYVVLGDGASIGDRVVIDAHCIVGAGVQIGEDSQLFPGVVLYPGTTLGRRVSLHAGVRVGSDGFGYVFRNGAHEKIPHVGRCIIEDDVEVGANTTIDRGSIDDTVIGAGTKIDNLVHIAHNVRIGRLCLILAQVGMAGSLRVEDGCIIAGQAGLAGHHTIGKGARVGAQAGVFGDVPAGETWSGYPARPHAESMRAQAALFKLPRLIRRLERLAGREQDPP